MSGLTGSNSINQSGIVGGDSCIGSIATTTTGLISGGSLDIDNVLINGTTIGHTCDTDLITVGNACLTIKGAVTVGVNDTGHDVKFFGATAGAYILYDQSCDQLEIRGAAADAATSTGKLLLTTANTVINANDVIGSINFQAPLEAGGCDSILVAAGIRAVAQATFTCAVNATDLIFYTGHSEAAAERFRFTSQNEIGIAGANYGTDGQVLTSGGAGAAAAWEDAGGLSGTGGTDNAILRANGTGGATLQNSGVTINDSHQVLHHSGSNTAPGISFACDATQGLFRVGSNVMGYSTGSANTLIQWNGSGATFTGDCANGNLTVGYTVNQACNDNQIFALKSSDIAHGVTNSAETDTYYSIQKLNAAYGGVEVYAFSDGHDQAFRIQAIAGACANAGKSTSSFGVFDVLARKRCSTSTTTIGSNGNIASFRDCSTTRFLFDAEGSGHADVEWTTYSDNRLKFNQEVVPYGLDTLLQLQPKIYCKDSGYLENGIPVLEGQRRRQIGFVAQEVKALIPESVKDVCSDTSWYSLEDGKLTAVVVKAVQELTTRVEALEGK